MSRLGCAVYLYHTAVGSARWKATQRRQRRVLFRQAKSHNIAVNACANRLKTDNRWVQSNLSPKCAQFFHCQNPKRSAKKNSWRTAGTMVVTMWPSEVPTNSNFDEIDCQTSDKASHDAFKRTFCREEPPETDQILEKRKIKVKTNVFGGGKH